MLQKCKHAALVIRNACFWRCNASIFAWFSICFSCVFWKCCPNAIFVRFCQILSLNWRSFGRHVSDKLQIWKEEWVLKVKSAKLYIFDRFLSRGRRQGRASWKTENLQNLRCYPTRPAPPAGVRRILRLRPCRRPPLINNNLFLVFLGPILIFGRMEIVNWVILRIWFFKSEKCKQFSKLVDFAK